jgi:hypothetical protein
MLSFAMPVAYDYRYFYRALDSIYDIADEIVVGLDRDRISWSGKPYQLDEAEFRAEIQKTDTRGIVKIVEDDFHSSPQPMVNDSEERNTLARHCTPGSWIIQIDSDEQALNAKDFRKWMQTADREKDVQAKWITVFKTFGDQCLVANEPDGKVSVGTTQAGAYKYARETGRPKVPSNLLLLHFSWGRTRDELAQKLTNWSHSKDFDTAKFLDFWDSVNLTNYRQFKNFHPLYPPLWSSLSLVKIPAARTRTPIARPAAAP